MIIKMKPSAEKLDDMLKILDDNGFSYKMDELSVHCGTGQEKQLLTYLDQGGISYQFEHSNECLVSWEVE